MAASDAPASAPSTALATREEPARAMIPKSDPPMSYVLAFGKNQFYVPHDAVISYPKSPVVKIQDGVELGNLLFTKAPSSWENHCHPDFLMHIRGTDGSTCVYTTFQVPGHPNEERFVRFIGGTIAEKNFEKKKRELKDIKPANERQRKRMAVLDWVKEKDCPDRAQLNPELCGWTQLKGENGTEAPLKSCKVDPESKKRTKPAGDKATEDACDMIKFQKTIKGVGPKGSYSIIEQDGFIHFVQYKTDADKTKDGDEDEP